MRPYKENRAEVSTLTDERERYNHGVMDGFVYRGVHGKHPAIASARQGVVVPGDRRGSITPDIRNRGGWQDRSPFTSWTLRFEVAQGYASEEPAGVILRLPYSGERPVPSKAEEEWLWVRSPDLYDEAEVLLKGVRIDAEVVWHG